jgi:hypothetical protein
MSQRGIIYLIQPGLLVGSKIYKLGCSNSPTLSRCINGYIKGSRYISIHECYDPLIVEKILIKKFNNLFRLAGGTESFEGDENIMSITILQTIIEYKQNNTNNNNITDDTTNNTASNNTTTNTAPNDTISNDTISNDTTNDITNIKNNYNCKICKSYYSSYQSLWIHNKKYHTYNCEKCKKKFDNLQNKLTHQKICICNSNQKICICNSNQNVKLDLDTLKHNTTNNLLCKYCNKIFSRTDSLNRHQLKCKIKKAHDITIKDNTELEEKIKTVLLKINSKTADNNS